MPSSSLRAGYTVIRQKIEAPTPPPPALPCPSLPFSGNTSKTPPDSEANGAAPTAKRFLTPPLYRHGRLGNVGNVGKKALIFFIIIFFYM